jgi:hypothetical protein
MSGRVREADETPPLWFPFDADPPDAAACLERLHAAFGSYAISYPWCRQCFSLEDETRMLRADDPRHAPLNIFSPIYFESPHCSGGEDTFKHWLPRGLELAGLDVFGYASIMDRAWSLQLWRWPLEEQAALRAAFARALIGLIAQGEGAPIALGDNAMDWAVERLVGDLLLLRVDPDAMFGWLVGREETLAWSALAGLFESSSIMSEQPCQPSQDPEAAERLRAALAACRRRVRTALSDVLTMERFEAARERERRRAPGLADKLLTLGVFRDVYAAARTPCERAEDEAVLRAALEPLRAPPSRGKLRYKPARRSAERIDAPPGATG